jgi:NAD(P)-dependent dehydrogenase (short-subunit alcohol dehydrogenase family)
MDVGTRAVVVTGGAGGMGVAIAHALAPLGTVILADIDADRLESVRRDLAQAGASVETAVCDVTKEEDVVALGERVGALGGLRALAHTAGLSPQMSDGRTVLDVDLVGTARVLDALAPHAGPGTAAVCVGSIAGYADLAPELDTLLDDPLADGFLDVVAARLTVPLDGTMGYVLAKRGVMRACERLSGPWGRQGARLVSIAPGLIDTEMGRLEMTDSEIVTALIEATPIKRPEHSPLPGSVADIAALVEFLCSDAGSFISGCDIRIDGGLIGSGRIQPASA